VERREASGDGRRVTGDGRRATGDGRALKSGTGDAPQSIADYRLPLTVEMDHGNGDGEWGWRMGMDNEKDNGKGQCKWMKEMVNGSGEGPRPGALGLPEAGCWGLSASILEEGEDGPCARRE
jgi:hypothetical protein